MSEMIYYFYNDYHYGDNILNLKFLNNINKYLEKYNILIYYYYNPYYIKRKQELEVYIHTDRIHLFTNDTKPSFAIHLWIGNFPTLHNIPYTQFDTYYNLYYQTILEYLKLNHEPINTSLYQEEKYLVDIYEQLDVKYKNVDILIINSVPYSGQCKYNKEEWDKICIALHQHYRIVTTTFVNDSIPCTFHDKLTIQQIGALSTQCTYIIGVHSGPITACYNQLTKQKVLQWIIFQDNGNIHNDLRVIDHACIRDLYLFFNIPYTDI